jgi:hypothetical protein
MKKILFTLALLISFSSFGQTKSGYKINTFKGEWGGWLTVTITHKQNITIMLYADENEYHASGTPLYILDGKIGSTGIKGENPNLVKVDFNVLWSQSGKSDLLPCKNCIYYFSNGSGKDSMGKLGYEDSFDELIAQ